MKSASNRANTSIFSSVKLARARANSAASTVCFVIICSPIRCRRWPHLGNKQHGALPQGTTRDDAKAMFEKSAPNYRGVPGLVRKYYLYGDDQTGGGVYLWNSREAAERFYSDAWKSTIAQRYGAQPEISFYDTSVIVENADQKASAA